MNYQGPDTFTEASTYALWHAEEAGLLLFWTGWPLMVTKGTVQSTKVHFSQYHVLSTQQFCPLLLRFIWFLWCSVAPSSEISTCQRKGTMFPSIYDGRGKSNLHLYVDCPLLPCSLYKQPGVCKRKTLSLIYNISVSDRVFTGWQITNSRQQNTNT